MTGPGDGEPPVEAFFSGVALEFWEAVASGAWSDGDVAFVEAALGPVRPCRILDVPCGHGRHSFRLARRGHLVTAVDGAPEVVARGRARSQGFGPEVSFWLLDMRGLPWDGAFDTVLCLGNSFGYFARPGMEAFLGGVSRALVPGGRFVVDSGAVAESLLPHLEAKIRFTAGDILVLAENSYEAIDSRLDTTYTFVRDGREVVRRHSHWVYTLAEIDRMVRAAGLSTREVWGSQDRRPYRVGDRCLYLVAEKPSAAPARSEG